MSEPFVGERIILRAVTDSTFRAGLAADPERTLKEAGFEVTRDQLNAIVLAKPAEWGNLTPEDIQVRIDTLAKKR
jgi:di/tripeptidase